MRCAWNNHRDSYFCRMENLGVTDGRKTQKRTPAGRSEPERRQKGDRIEARKLFRFVPAGGIGGIKKTCRRLRKDDKPFSFRPCVRKIIILEKYKKNYNSV